MIDFNLKGVLYGIAAALPVFRKQGFGISSTPASTAGAITMPAMSVYSCTKFAVRAISEGLRREDGDKLRVTIISPGVVQTDFAESMTHPGVKAQIVDTTDKMTISSDAIARAIAFAIEQPADVDVGDRPLDFWVIGLVAEKRPSSVVALLVALALRARLREKNDDETHDRAT